MSQLHQIGGFGASIAVPIKAASQSGIWAQPASGRRIMVCVAHPDDEVLMCGGTIAKHVKAGDTVCVLILSSGVGSRGSMDGLADRIEACDRASNILGCNGEVLDFPDQQFDTVPILTITKAIEQRMAEYLPETVYSHWRGDMNMDHRITSDAVTTACRPYPGQSVRRLLYGETPSATEWGQWFVPTWFVALDDDDLTDKKYDALKCYSIEMREYPHPRSIDAITAVMRLRGAAVGVGYAEAFMLARNLT